MSTKGSIDVAETLGELHQVTELTELDTSGKDAGPLGQVHPLGWAALGLLALAVVFHLKGSNWLIGNFSWWHWVGLLIVVVLAARPPWIKKASQIIDRVTDFLENGANSFGHPWAAFVCSLMLVTLAGLLVGPLLSFADWIFGVTVEPISTSEFQVTSSSAGWIRTAVFLVVVVTVTLALYRLLSRVLPEGPISVKVGALCALGVFALTMIVMTITSGWQPAVPTAFALAIVAAGLALGVLWTMSWGIFFVIFFYVVTRYTNRFVETDLLIGEVNSLALQLFGLLAILGVGYGVKAGVNPRIDFWWAEFSNRRKAWLDFVLHTLFFVPFLWASLRLLHSYSKNSLGFKRPFTGEGDGDWPASWHVWETWNQASDAGNLPVGPVRAMIFVGFVLFLLQVISELIKGGFVLIGREDLADLKQTDAPARVE